MDLASPSTRSERCNSRGQLSQIRWRLEGDNQANEFGSMRGRTRRVLSSNPSTLNSLKGVGREDQQEQVDTMHV